ncbi:hypothetical protein [Methanosarcina sp.]|uniref:hypothetical protein n=1 Tax=Methanosarcina sp. TaxID=2213 RepID=UPI0029888D2E|nr:hypothetical protein [Methanosarcina sp.]MDW5549713.1 hypothetical protein [Methanosarcina sp.]MDW5552885.1 hypothetical protein [Methanosarcina sp.]MDW5558100.1 hypothetical protein [Methanosarcina sp.]
MKIDNIVKQELWRSTAVYFVFLLFFIYLYKKGYLSVEPQIVFILPLIFTAIHFSLLVWYREKEQLLNPSISLIIGHIFESESHEEKIKKPYENEETSISFSIKKNLRLLILIILLYITYLYASLVYNIDQIFWILFLLFMGFVLSKIIYDESTEAGQKDPVRLLIFYVIACVFIFVRYLILDYPILPILKGSIILGALLVLLVLGIK